MRAAIAVFVSMLAAGGGAVAAEREDAVPEHEDAQPPSVDPNHSRLLFAPTARPLKKGEGYFTDYELVFPGVAYGLTDNISLAGGLSVVPGLGFDEQVYYVSPKVGFELSERASVAVGALAVGGGPFFGDGDRDDKWASVAFALGTFGGPHRSVTVGVGVGDSSGFADAVPIVMAGGTAVVSRHVALIGETWMVLDDDFRLDDQPIGLGVRLFSDRLSADLGVIVSGDLLDGGFPIPWVSVSYHFGRDR